VPLLALTDRIADQLATAFEVMLAHLCGANVQPFAGMPLGISYHQYNQVVAKFVTKLKHGVSRMRCGDGGFIPVSVCYLIGDFMLSDLCPKHWKARALCGCLAASIAAPYLASVWNGDPQAKLPRINMMGQGLTMGQRGRQRPARQALRSSAMQQSRANDMSWSGRISREKRSLARLVREAIAGG
jgi:hypothetical protein